MGTRQRSQLPIRDNSSKRLKITTANKKTTNSTQDFSDHQTAGVSSSRNHLLSRPQFQDPLTPLHRLRRFKEIRDRNLGKTKSKKPFHKKMSVDVEREDTADGSENIKENKNMKENHEKITNGQQENGEKIQEESGEIEKKVVVIEENGLVEVNGSKDKISNTKVIVESKEVENEVVKGIEPLDSDDDTNSDSNVADEVEPKPKEETPYQEPLKQEPPREPVRVLRSTARQEMVRSSPQPSTSKQPSESVQSSSVSQKTRDKERSLSPEALRRMISPRLQGRRSIHYNRTEFRKRKLEHTGDDGNAEKKSFRGGDSTNSPSILSPGWKFISSPFTRFWSPQNTSAAGNTPYKSVTYTNTPYADIDNEISMAVNVDDRSLYSNLNDSELGLNVDSNTKKGWGCHLM